MSQDTCNTCSVVYEYDESKLDMHVYPDSICNHLMLVCPKGHPTKLYINWHKLAQILNATKPRLRQPKYHFVTPPELLESAKAIWEKHLKQKEPADLPLPELPPLLRIQLYDYLRNPGGNAV